MKRQKYITIADLERIRDSLRQCRNPPMWDGEKWVYVFQVRPRPGTDEHGEHHD